jgi:acyl carrier protein
MEIQSFLTNFTDQFDDTDVSVITPETKFRDIEEWDSLTSLSIIAMVDEEYNVKISGEDFRNSQTIKDLFEIVKSKKN